MVNIKHCPCEYWTAHSLSEVKKNVLCVTALGSNTIFQDEYNEILAGNALHQKTFVRKMLKNIPLVTLLGRFYFLSQ